MLSYLSDMFYQTGIVMVVVVTWYDRYREGGRCKNFTLAELYLV